MKKHIIKLFSPLFVLFTINSTSNAILSYQSTRALNSDITNVVISEVYGGGGESSAPYKYDYIELYNNSDSVIELNGWYVHYGASTTDLNFKTSLSGRILPRSFYLIKELGTGTNGLELPLSDISGSITMARGAFKVALTNNDVKPTTVNDTNVIDFIGAGNANMYEGSRALYGSVTESLQRVISEGVAIDTNDNGNDFILGVPSPMNSALSIATKIMAEDEALQCITKYPEVKSLLGNLSVNQLNYFQNDNENMLLISARERYQAWSLYHNDTEAYPLINQIRTNDYDQSELSVIAIVLIGVLGLTTIILYYFINKKKIK